METINNLQDLFQTDFRHLPEKVVRNFEATEELQQLRRDIKNNIPHSNWSSIREELLSELQKLLDIDLESILIESWKTHQDISREVHQQKTEQSDEIAIVPLADHEIRSSHSPSLIIQIEDATHALRTFIGLTLNLTDVTVKVQHGEIIEIISGTVNGSGFLQYQNATLVEQDFLNFSIAGILKSGITNGEETSGAAEITADQPADIMTSSQNEEKVSVHQETPPSLRTNMIQFIIGISIAFIAMYLFWQFK